MNISWLWFFSISGDSCAGRQTKVGYKQSGQYYYLSSLKNQDQRWLEHYSMRFWDCHAPWLELLKIHI